MLDNIYALFSLIGEIERQPTKIPFILHFIVQVCFKYLCQGISLLLSTYMSMYKSGRAYVCEIVYFGAIFITLVPESWSETNIISKAQKATN